MKGTYTTTLKVSLYSLRSNYIEVLFLCFPLNGGTDGTDFDVSETGVRIGILIVRAGTIRFVVHPGHLAAIAGTAPHGHGQDHSSPHSL